MINTLVEIFSDAAHAREISSNHKREIILPAKTQLHHILIHSDHISSYAHLITTDNVHHAVQNYHLDIHQKENSRYQASIIASGDALQHLHIHNYLSEAHAESNIQILHYGHSNQKISVESTAYHEVKHTRSNTLARGIMTDKAKGNFTGKIVVAAGAEKAAAKLENKNILLSKQAEMNTRPLLEVYHGDIQCSHGATVGHLDEEALFYLRARGIPETEAKNMLIKAFMAPALQHLLATPNWYTAIEAMFDG